MFAERIYPTTDKMLNRILMDNPDFPVRSTTSLWRWIKKLGFVYKRTSKVTVPLDGLSFMAARARYFTAIEKFRSNGSKMSGMMKLGVTSMKKNRTFGLMAQQAQAVFGKVMEKVNSALRLI